MRSIRNVRVVTEDGILENSIVRLCNGKIASISPDQGEQDGFDGKNAILVPGFIDLHVHGGAGYDFMDMQEEALEKICDFHAAHGTTGLLATTMTTPMTKLREIIDFYKKNFQPKGILGLHLEGPFINEKYKGAQNRKWIQSPTLEDIKELFDRSGPELIKMITFAPELVQDERVWEFLQQKSIILAAGHSDLTYQEGCQCIMKGLQHATHLGNAMRSFHHREIGILGMVMEGKLSFDLIADGIHISPDLIRLLTRICSLDQLICITDAMRAAGLVDGEYDLGGQIVRVKGREARLIDGVLAGSLLTLDQALRNMIEFTGLSLVEVLPFLTLNPARKLGLEQSKGSIRSGKDADLVLLDDQLVVLATWKEGNIVYQREL